MVMMVVMKLEMAYLMGNTMVLDRRMEEGITSRRYVMSRDERFDLPFLFFYAPMELIY